MIRGIELNSSPDSIIIYLSFIIASFQLSTMPKTIYDKDVISAMQQAQEASRKKQTKKLQLGNSVTEVPYPFPSPVDWREHWIYFLMIDRFNNPSKPPASESLQPAVAWDHQFGHHQGGTFKGNQQQLDYIASLGAGAIWLSPVLKNPKPG